MRGTKLFAALGAALALALCLAVATQADPRAADPSPHGIVVRALASGGLEPLPVRDAAVRIVVDGKVVARGPIGSHGMALVGHFARAPRDFEVILSGGEIGGRRFGAHLLADVHDYRAPRTVHIDPVTTLVARYAAAHPGRSRRHAERTVKRFLDLPGSYEVGLDGRTDVGFDGRRFLAAAGRGRHYERFVAKLVGSMEDGHAHRSFARPTGHADRELADFGDATGTELLDGPPAEGLAQVAEQITEKEGFFDLLEKGATLLDFANTGMAIAGAIEGAETRAEIEAMSAKLSQVEETLAVVEETVDNIQAEDRKSAYSQAAAEAEPIQTAVESGEDTLNSAAELALQEGCDSPNTPHGERCAEVAGMLTGENGFVENMRASGLSAPAQVNTYAERIAGDALEHGPHNADGLIQDASYMASGNESQLFFTPPESAQLRSVAAYWITSYTESLGLAATFWGLDGANKATLENDVKQVQEVAPEMSGALPSALEGGAAIDVRNGTMWSTRVAGAGTTKQSYQELAGQNWAWDPEAGEWVSGQGTRIGALGSERPSLPFSNWQMAGVSQIHELQNAVATSAGRTPGAALFAQGEFSFEALVPSYRREGSVYVGTGLEWEYALATSQDQPGCKGEEWTCVWPVWAGNEEVTDFHRQRGVHEYDDGTFEVPWYDVEWASYPLWGWDNEGTLYGADPIGDIPYLFYRGIGEGECYYYPTSGAYKAGSPGCPER